MTPKARANWCYYTAIVCCMIGAVLLVIGRSRNNAVATVCGAALISAFVLTTVYSLAASRCPHCRRHIDLRGPAAYCPRCGHWIPAREGDSPAIIP
jgi:Zn finger protein HypA/HybF involved in hydrogenase expression